MFQVTGLSGWMSHERFHFEFITSVWSNQLQGWWFFCPGMRCGSSDHPNQSQKMAIKAISYHLNSWNYRRKYRSDILVIYMPCHMSVLTANTLPAAKYIVLPPKHVFPPTALARSCVRSVCSSFFLTTSWTARAHSGSHGKSADFAKLISHMSYVNVDKCTCSEDTTSTCKMQRPPTVSSEMPLHPSPAQICGRENNPMDGPMYKMSIEKSSFLSKKLPMFILHPFSRSAWPGEWSYPMHPPHQVEIGWTQH